MLVAAVVVRSGNRQSVAAVCPGRGHSVTSDVVRVRTNDGTREGKNRHATSKLSKDGHAQFKKIMPTVRMPTRLERTANPVRW